METQSCTVPLKCCYPLDSVLLIVLISAFPKELSGWTTRQVGPNPNSTLSSGNTLVNLSGALWIDRLLKEVHILHFVQSPLMGLQCEPVKGVSLHIFTIEVV